MSVYKISDSCLRNETCKEYTCLTLLATYRKLYGIRVIVFTNDPTTRRIGHEFGFISLPIMHHNQYGMPILKYLFLDAMKTSKTRLYT